MIRTGNVPITARRYRTNLRSHNGLPYCVALLDLMFLLLLFTAMSTQVIRISGIRVDLPQADAPQESVLGKLVVTITPGEYENDCRFYYVFRYCSYLNHSSIRINGCRNFGYFL